jgi:hypothetical protein
MRVLTKEASLSRSLSACACHSVTLPCSKKNGCSSTVAYAVRRIRAHVPDWVLDGRRSRRDDGVPAPGARGLRPAMRAAFGRRALLRPAAVGRDTGGAGPGAVPWSCRVHLGARPARRHWRRRPCVLLRQFRLAASQHFRGSRNCG